MEIERINDNTVKFYISYMDIEDRGFNREEIWYNRERSEQLFWQVMDEAGDEESFDMEGPLWIQVQALEKGLEITVTKAQLSKDGQNLELPIDSPGLEKHFDDKLEDLLDSKFGQTDNEEDDAEETEEELGRLVHHTVAFEEFEDIIQLSHAIEDTDGIENEIYHYQNQYMMILKFNDETHDEHVQDDLLSVIFEFGKRVKLAVPVILEYGNLIFAEDALAQVKKHFNR
ncbi:adaptor protein MecA [Amphibacillus cookii]|uniref:adaptor protein MecA n=1 Tax=Amphibacillus cookii TaxID=767787 RepID=UPI001957EC2C|nr:adaptor protein MecA [Amphibacillus cookii]MBM7540170.1 adapter protein MecA 1/2 [Amphibacillus cookii]